MILERQFNSLPYHVRTVFEDNNISFSVLSDMTYPDCQKLGLDEYEIRKIIRLYVKLAARRKRKKD